jgi:hypothetical protein
VHHFGEVVIHTDALSAAAARSIDATSYTVGSHIFFGAGRFQPGTRTGDRLLAHELTHVVQQGGGDAPVHAARMTQPHRSRRFARCRPYADSLGRRRIRPSSTPSAQNFRRRSLRTCASCCCCQTESELLRRQVSIWHP